MPLRPLQIALVGRSEGTPRSEEICSERRAALYKSRNRSCAYCGHFSPLGRALEVDHLDGNHNNWSPDNLELACHWCHTTRHLEFALRAHAVLVQWDYPQSAISRLTHQCLQAIVLRETYEKLVEEGVKRREHNFPDGSLGSIDLKLRGMMNRGDMAGANAVLNDLNGHGIRLVFPASYLNDSQQVPPEFTSEAWHAACAYYRRIHSAILIDNDRRARLAFRHRQLQRGEA